MVDIIQKQRLMLLTSAKAILMLSMIVAQKAILKLLYLLIALIGLIHTRMYHQVARIGIILIQMFQQIALTGIIVQSKIIHMQLALLQTYKLH